MTFTVNFSDGNTRILGGKELDAAFEEFDRHFKYLGGDRCRVCGKIKINEDGTIGVYTVEHGYWIADFDGDQRFINLLNLSDGMVMKKELTLLHVGTRYNDMYIVCKK